MSLKAKFAEAENIIKGRWMSGLGHFLRKCIFNVISVGPIPNHIAFIMDGNRRFEKKHKLAQGEGHKAGLIISFMVMLNHCYELGVKCVTVYAFSIENFKRKPDEVQLLIDIILELMEELSQDQSILFQNGIRLYFVGNWMLLTDKLRATAQKAMKLTESNDKAVLVICFAYTSTDEMAHAVDESCREKQVGKKIEFSEDEIVNHGEEQVIIRLSDVEKKMYMAVAPDPDIVIRSSGEKRLSNFLTWQTSNSLLYSPAAMWPEISLWQLVWGVLEDKEAAMNPHLFD